jgi:8-amino-7-oxononanoate synthase
MRDFSSALYLGMHHSSADLGSWTALTSGRPAAMEASRQSRMVCQALAQIQGTEAAVLLPSTLHLFQDLFGMLASDALVILVDGAAYPVARWGADHASCLGLPLAVFPSGSGSDAAGLAGKWTRAGRRPVILTDGIIPGTGMSPPLAQYARIVREHKGFLIVDDTQSLGVVGPQGGGSAAAHDVQGERILIGASLAKGFGAPVACLSGSAAMINRFNASSLTRRHNSPPSVAAVRAAWCALRLNASVGKQRRCQLRQRIRQFREGIGRLCLASSGGEFPVQVLHLDAAVDGAMLHQCLRRHGVQAVLQSDRSHAAIAFLIRADHTCDDIDFAIRAVAAYFQEVVWKHNLKPCRSRVNLPANTRVNSTAKWHSNGDVAAAGVAHALSRDRPGQ